MILIPLFQYPKFDNFHFENQKEALILTKRCLSLQKDNIVNIRSFRVFCIQFILFFICDR